MATISNVNSNTLVSGTAYNDTISNTGENVSINAGAGNDSIYSSNNTHNGAYKIGGGIFVKVR